MVGGQGAQRVAEQGLVEAAAHVDEDGLVPVVRVGHVLLEEPALDRGQHGRADRHVGDGADRPRLGRDRREPRDGLLLQHLAGSDAQAGGRRPGRYLEAGDGVAAQGEEAVVDADLVGTQDVPPDPGQRALRVGTRWRRFPGSRGRRGQDPVQRRALCRGEPGDPFGDVAWWYAVIGAHTCAHIRFPPCKLRRWRVRVPLTGGCRRRG